MNNIPALIQLMVRRLPRDKFTDAYIRHSASVSYLRARVDLMILAKMIVDVRPQYVYTVKIGLLAFVFTMTRLFTITMATLKMDVLIFSVGFFIDSGHPRAVMHARVVNSLFLMKSMVGKTFIAFPAHARPAIWRIC